eukprot:g28411.t1
MPVPSSWTTPIRELREEVHQELQNFSARLAAVEARLASPLTPGGEARQRRQSVWKTPTAQTAQSEPSEVTPKSTNRKIWKTNSDAPGTPSNYVETNQPHETWLNANEATSLVTRVCTGDGALILSNRQATLVAQINSFLGLQMDQFDLPVLQIGTLLCILCILLWSLCVYKEFRRISLALAGAVQIPRGRYTQFREGQFFVTLGPSVITFGLVTASGRGNFEQLTVSEMAVREHKFRSPGETPEAVYISFTSDEDLFGFDIARSMTETAALYPICLETDVLAMGGSLSNDSGIGGGARLLLRQAAAVFGIADADNCTELRDTCRCTDPLASPWYRVPHQGCGLPCLALAASEQRGCTDVSPQEAAWAKFWDNYPGVISMHFGTDIQSSAAFPAVNQTIQAMKLSDWMGDPPREQLGELGWKVC